MTKPLSTEEKQRRAQERADITAANKALDETIDELAEEHKAPDGPVSRYAEILVTRRFHTIKRPFSAQGVRCKWAEGTEDGSWTVKSTNDPHPCTIDFLAAFDAFAQFIDAPLGHTKAQQQGSVVLGVEIKYNKEGEESVYVTTTRPIDGYQVISVTLGKFAAVGPFGAAVDQLALCANKYLNGEKLQLELPQDGDESDTAQQADLMDGNE